MSRKSIISVSYTHLYLNEKLRPWLPHFDKLENAERRNAVIYDMVLAALAYEKEDDEEKKEKLLDEILYYKMCIRDSPSILIPSIIPAAKDSEVVTITCGIFDRRRRMVFLKASSLLLSLIHIYAG